MVKTRQSIPARTLLTLLAVFAAGERLLAQASAPASESAVTQPAVRPATESASRPSPVLLEWTTHYAEAIRQAEQSGRPVLVQAGAVWCRWCKELEKEIAKPEVQAELRSWVRIYVDVDRPPREARSLAFGPVPAFRILSSSGRLVDSRDGYMEADDLLEWLKEKHAAAAPPKAVSGPEQSKELIASLVADLDRRDPAVREAAIRRLMLVPGKAAGPVVEAMTQGGLATRLAALEIVQEWGGPTQGLDPWLPETLTPEALERLRNWASQGDKISASRPTELSGLMLAAADRDLSALLREEVSAAEADAIRERLARYGQAMLPRVYETAGQVTTDRARERLTALRYRLVATDELVFAWPGGIERLAAMDVETRHAAADELAARCGSADEPLLLELFSDPDGLVREIALRGLQKVGGSQASSALVRLLQDPEPNVRAAVLKQMAESPSSKVIPKIAEYVAAEKDADLVVHAIRVLRAAKGKSAAECLMGLLGHVNWQVRAEAAEGLGEILSGSSPLSNTLKKDGYAALLKLLEDSDGFVVSVAVKSLRSSELKGAADALARAADKHPELAADVLNLLAESTELRAKAIPHLRRFCGHENAVVRAVAIGALCTAAPANVEKELAAALSDSASRVRIAAATALLQLIQAQRPRPDQDAVVHMQASGGLMSALFGGLRKSSRTSTSTRPAGSRPVASGPASSPASAPAEPAVTREVARDDQWLDDFRAGVKRPKWMESLVPPLEAMLAAESTEERLAAAVDLVPFGRDDKAIAVLKAAIAQNSDLAGTASAALPWLPWDKRLELFEALAQAGSGPETVMQIAQNMAIWPDPRAAQPLWRQFEQPRLTPEQAGRLLEALRRIYFGEYSYNASSAPVERRRHAIAEAAGRAQSGPELQRVAALALLLGVSLKDAGEQAAAIARDANAGPQLRQDAFQVQLLSASRSGGQKLAAEALAGSDPELRTIALRFIAEGPETLNALRNGAFYLYYQNAAVQRAVVMTSGQVINISAPSGLTPEAVRPLLESPEPRTAAVAGYLLATLKDPAGLDRLVSYWRDQARDDEAIKRLVYRAVAALNDDRQTALLEEIYRTYSKEDYWLRDYYWTIRSMTGPDVIKLRKVIRDEVGMDRLR